MDKKESNYLDVLKERFLKNRTIAWSVLIVIIIGGIATLLQNLYDITDFLRPAKPSVSVVSYALASGESIFEEKEQSTGIRYFHVPDKKRFIMIDLSRMKNGGSEIPASLSALNNAIDYLFTEQKNNNIPIHPEDLNEIFEKKDRHTLLKLIAPADPKSPGYDKINESRKELFKIVKKILSKESMEEGHHRLMRNSVIPYRPLLMGRFEPIFNLTLQNNGARPAIIDRVDVAVKSVTVHAALIQAAPIPVVEIVDATVPSEPGTSIKRLENPIEILPDESRTIPVRMNTEARGLQSYTLKIDVKGPNVEGSTDYFVLQM